VAVRSHGPGSGDRPIRGLRVSRAHARDGIEDVGGEGVERGPTAAPAPGRRRRRDPPAV